MKCDRCHVDMINGFALWPWYLRFVSYFAPQPSAEKLKECWKCPKCGASREIRVHENWN